MAGSIPAASCQVCRSGSSSAMHSRVRSELRLVFALIMAVDAYVYKENNPSPPSHASTLSEVLSSDTMAWACTRLSDAFSATASTREAIVASTPFT